MTRRKRAHILGLDDQTITVIIIGIICLIGETVNALPIAQAPSAWQTALSARGPQYKPRTEHLLSDGRPQYLNRLILETSPYLRQHAHNPVEWFPWGEEAFEVAMKEDKPILLSIGYSTCHWCHVMERESFEDQEIATYINQHYVAIKVDREERPDLDDVYMKAVQALSGRGGWPMTTLLTPQKVPFFGGTYFPPRDGARGRRKGFLTILKEYSEKFTSDRTTLLAAAQRLSRYINKNSRIRPSANAPSAEVVTRAAQRLADRFDKQRGGFGKAPKFPTPPNLSLLLRYYQRTGDEQATYMLNHTLKTMAWGGIYDHIGGGFHRYSTDARWRVPHFEKMLYDNAQLMPLYLRAALYASPDQKSLFREIATATLSYLNREMRSPEALYYSATDADSLGPGAAHPEEGLFFMWTPAELKAVLNEDEQALATSVYNITNRGDLDGRNILHRTASWGEIARQRMSSLEQLAEQISHIHDKLYTARAKRPPPLRDDKAITSWNGLMISALVSGARYLDHDYLRYATQTAEAVLQRLQLADRANPKPLLARTYMEGRARHHAVLDDYAFLIQGLLDLFEESGDPKWLTSALGLQSELDQHYIAKRWGGYFMTSDRGEKLITRDRPDYDGAEPSGNSISALNLLRFYALTDRAHFLRSAEILFRGFASLLERGSGLGTMVSALLHYHGQARQLALIIPEQTPNNHPLLKVLTEGDWPNTVIVRCPNEDGARRLALERLIPWLKEKRSLSQEGSTRPTAYLCYEGICERPILTADELHQSLSRRAPLLSDRSPEPLTLP